MKIAITGSTGFLGKHLINHLKQQKISYSEFDKKEHNLFRPETLKNFVLGKDVVIHLAAVNRGDNENLIKTNVLGTLGLLEAILRYSPKAKIIFASSFQVYLKNSLYGLSKKMAENLIKYYANQFDLKATILRMSNLYGPNCRPFYNSVIATFAHQIAHDGLIIINGDGKQKRDFIYVKDVVEAIIKCIFYQQKERIEYFDMCSGKKTSLKEVVKIFQKICPKKFEIHYNKGIKDQWGTINKNYQRAKKILGWKPKTTLTAGLGQTIKSFYED